MDLLHSSGVSSTFYLQTQHGGSRDYFLFISKATDMRNTFFLLFPIWFHVWQWEGVKLLWVAVVGDWVNLIVKWLLFGERPYWWVQETRFYDNSTRPMIEQFPLTCETGPGSPSGHAMGAAAVYYTMTSSLVKTLLRKEGKQLRKWCVCVSLWMLFWCVQVCVSVSRVFIAAHFPHQVVMGVILGVMVAEFLHRAQQIFRSRLQFYLLASLLLLSLALLLYLGLQLLGVDLLWSVEKARRWCRRPEWVNMDTSPLASLFRNSGALLGLGLGLHSPMHAHAHRAAVGAPAWAGSRALYRLVCASATLVLLQLFDSAFRPPAHAGALFYLLSFCKSASVPLVTVAIVPYCVARALGRQDNKLV